MASGLITEGNGGLKFFGDKIGNRNGNIRIMYNNINGLKINDFLKSKVIGKIERKKKKMLQSAKRVEKMTGALAIIRKWDANVVCLSESQCAWEHYHVRDSVGEELRQIDRYAGFIGSSSCAACGDAYKPGGTLTIYDGNWSGRIKKGTDNTKLGRWSYVTITGRNNTFLTIVTGYRCVKQQTLKTAGITTSYMQQERILRQRGITSTPQTSFIDDMEKFVMYKLNEGHEILIAVDANEQWEDKNSAIKDLALRLGLHDIAKERNPEGVPPSYVRANSGRRIDLLLGTERVLNATCKYGMIIEGLDIIGDHRPQYVDININELLQLNAHDIGSPSSRRLRSTDPKCTEKYCQEVKAHFKNHKVFERLEQLWMETQKQVTMTKDQVKRYEAIDRDVYRLCTSAEHSLTLHTNTKYVWSPQLDEAVSDVQHWKLRKNNWNDRDKTEELVKQGIKKGIIDETKYSMDEISENLKQAYTTLRQTQEKDSEKRQEHLNRLADKYAEENKIAKEIAIRELMSHEELRELYRTVRLKMKGPRSPALSEVWTLDENEQKKIISGSSEVEEHLLHRNWSQLRQAANTPFADGELGEYIGWDGTGDMANRIVEGKPLPEIAHKHPVIQKYIEGMAMKAPNIKDTSDINITIEKYRRFWIKKRETTATSPFGLHIGHFKSVVGTENEDILEVHYRLMLLPFKFAMIPLRWARTVQVLLEKDIGRPWTNRLRIIELFDSQLNAGLQMIFGKAMIENGLEHNQIHPSAYGSVPKRTAQDAAMEKVMSLDIIRITKRTGAIFDCDAKGCYDRIVAPLQSIASRRLGVTRTTSLFFSRFWRVCEHHVKTRHGISKSAYASTSAEILYGIGQGNGAGPAFWLATLIVMFSVLDEICRGMTFSSPVGGGTYKSSGLGYVDDVTLGTTAKDNPEVNNDNLGTYSANEESEVHKEISDIGQYWEMMLHTNGGLLELRKCYWVMITWKWIRGEAVMKTASETETELKIKQTEDGREITIPKKDIGDAPRFLGVHIAVDGKWSREVGKWKTEAAVFAKKVKDARFSKSCGGRVYQSLWMAKLRYISQVVCFTKEEADDINRKVVTQCMCASGYNRNFPRRVVYGPLRYGGMEWETCASVQILEKIKFFLLHMRRQDKLGKLVTILMETVQLQSGLCDPLLNTTIRWQAWVEHTWLHNLKDGLDTINGAIHTNCWIPKAQRQYDRALMQVFASWNLTEKELRALNRCRLYLQVIFVSDITDLKGSKISKEAVQVVRFRDSGYRWARQARPIKSDRNIWRRSLLRLCYNDELITTLGRWISKSHQIWPYMTNKNGTKLLRYIGGVQHSMRQITKNIFFRFGSTLSEWKMGFPVQCVPIAIGYKAYDTDHRHIYRREELQIFQSDDKAIGQTLGYVKGHDLTLLKERWGMGDSWYIGTDGGLKDNIGTTGVTLFNKTIQQELCYSMAAETCGLGHLHSTREELKAVVAAEAIIKHCNVHFGHTKQHIEFICDNKSAIGKIKYNEKNQQQTVSPLCTEAELLYELTHLRSENNNIDRNFQWVESHKDDDTAYIMTEQDEMNQRADDLATTAREYVTEGLLATVPKQIYTNAMATLTIKGSVVSKNIKQVVAMAMYGDQMVKYLINKYDWNEETFHDIDWNAHEHEVTTAKGLFKVSIHKLLHRWQPTNKIVQRNERRPASEARCTECDEIDGQLHYSKCQSTYFEEARKFGWKKFKNILKKYKRNKTMLEIMWIGIQRWVYGEGDDSLPHGEEDTPEQYQLLVRAYKQQCTIGWDHFITGRITKQWSKYYEMTLENDSKKEGKAIAFARDIVKATWNFTLSVWHRHNEKVHGTNHKYSSRNIKSIRKCITDIYEKFQNSISEEDQWLFREESRIRCDQPVPQMIGWLERVLLCLEDIPEANDIVTKSKRLLSRMSVCSIFE